MSQLAKPLRLFSPADRTDWSCTIQTERELQLIKDIASRNEMAIRVNEEIGKVFLGRSKFKNRTEVNLRARVKPLAQREGDTCGLTSVAMAINSITGSDWNDLSLKAKYNGPNGYELLTALQEQAPSGHYVDCGNLSNGAWESVIRPSLEYRIPVIIGLNTPFSVTGRGHIVLIVALLDSEQVLIANPADGVFETTTRSAMRDARDYPGGKFIFARDPKLP